MPRNPFIVSALLFFALTGAGCAPKGAQPIGMPSESQIDSMTAEERTKAADDYQKANPPAPEKPATKDAATKLADDMQKMPQGTSGSFHRVVHDAAGSARLVKGPNGWAVVFGDDFRVDAGPDLHVYTSGNPDPRTSPEVHVDISIDAGSLTSTSGKQAYELGDIDITKVKSIVIYCKPFKVVFAVATLQ